ncbi:hypothetical protein TNCV_2535551 [Trichonephila clavipes]|nr:hypothetical protein TNCV_2535551 [Trichonephila clavipes]
MRIPKKKPRKRWKLSQHRKHSTESNKTPKKVTPTLLPSQLLLGRCETRNYYPGTPAANEETLHLKKINNDNDFGFKDAIRELRRFFRLPLSLRNGSN